MNNLIKIIDKELSKIEYVSVGEIVGVFMCFLSIMSGISFLIGYFKITFTFFSPLFNIFLVNSILLIIGVYFISKYKNIRKSEIYR